MISEAAIMAKLRAYAASPAGKKKINTFMDDARKTGKRLTDGTYIIGPKQMTEMANALVEIIRQKLPQSIAQVGDTLAASAPIKNSDGSYIVTLSFNHEALHRDSLENDLGYEGIDNIVALFNNGYHASNYVYGWWNRHKPTGEAIYRSGDADDYAWVRSKKDREPLRFMQEAEKEFNSIYGKKYNVTVKLGSDYTL